MFNSLFNFGNSIFTHPISVYSFYFILTIISIECLMYLICYIFQINSFSFWLNIIPINNLKNHPSSTATNSTIIKYSLSLISILCIFIYILSMIFSVAVIIIPWRLLIKLFTFLLIILIVSYISKQLYSLSLKVNKTLFNQYIIDNEEQIKSHIITGYELKSKKIELLWSFPKRTITIFKYTKKLFLSDAEFIKLLEKNDLI